MREATETLSKLTEIIDMQNSIIDELFCALMRYATVDEVETELANIREAAKAQKGL